MRKEKGPEAQNVPVSKIQSDNLTFRTSTGELISPHAVDKFERACEQTAKGSRYIEELSNYPAVALALVSEYRKEEDKGILERIRTVRHKFSIAFMVLEGKRLPDPSGSEYISDSNEKVYFQNYRKITPALDVVSDRLLILVPLPYERLIFDRKGNNIGSKKEIDNFIVTDKKELFRGTEQELTKRGLIAKAPDSLIDSRWSMNSLESFIRKGATVQPYDVFQDLLKAWDRFIDFGDNRGALVANTLYTVLSFFFFLFPSVPYIRFTGTKGAAKSKAGSIYELLGFNPLNAVSMSAASLFRSTEETRGLTVIDEAESYGKAKNKSENQEALDQIINSGWQAHGKVPRIETIGNRRQRVNYSTFGPKVICGISNVTETLRDRSFEILMVKTLDKTKSRRAVRASEPQWQVLRDGLYLLLMNYWQEVKRIAEGPLPNELDLTGRDWDKAKPLIVLAQFFARHAPDKGESLKAELAAFLKDQKSKQQEAQVDSIDFSIIEALEAVSSEKAAQMLKAPGEADPIDVQLSTLSERVAALEGIDIASGEWHKRRSGYSKFIRDKVQKMGLGIDFRRGHARSIYFSTTGSRLKSARERYFLEESTSQLTNAHQLTDTHHVHPLHHGDGECNNSVHPSTHPQENQQNTDSPDSMVSHGEHGERKYTGGKNTNDTHRDDPAFRYVVDLLINTTYNTTEKYRGVSFLEKASDQGVTHADLYENLEEAFRRGIVVKKGSKYAIKDLITEGSA